MARGCNESEDISLGVYKRDTTRNGIKKEKGYVRKSPSDKWEVKQKGSDVVKKSLTS